jgi:hypothetical protein
MLEYTRIFPCRAGVEVYRARWTGGQASAHTILPIEWIPKQSRKSIILGREGNTRPLNQLILRVIYICKYPLCHSIFQ